MTEMKNADNGVAYLTFSPLNKLNCVVNAFSTRVGGFSDGIYSTLNLNFNQGDDIEKVNKNFEAMGEAIGVAVENMVMAHQTHTANVMRVTKDNSGMGIIRERNYHDIDGIVTNEPGLCLVTSHADCIPLYFVDPVRNAIGLSHSGWKGTAGNIAKNTVELMKNEFGTDPKDVIGIIGPGICGECYEIGQDVADVFTEKYKGEEQLKVVRPEVGKEGKYLLDLHAANCYNMLDAGLTEKNIYVSDVCTMENSELLFSHRASKGKRGGLCAFLMLK
ncbi:MAG: peptidoglycan editing factor PgeF [Lachnospiraceae bacterium]|nr:peptidoglycan editing factor PgeF [Lachnospiraceae bacterium]